MGSSGQTFDPDDESVFRIFPFFMCQILELFWVFFEFVILRPVFLLKWRNIILQLKGALRRDFFNYLKIHSM